LVVAVTYLVFEIQNGETEFSQVFNFAILSYSHWCRHL